MSRMMTAVLMLCAILAVSIVGCNQALALTILTEQQMGITLGSSPYAKCNLTSHCYRECAYSPEKQCNWSVEPRYFPACGSSWYPLDTCPTEKVPCGWLYTGVMDCTYLYDIVQGQGCT